MSEFFRYPHIPHLAWLGRGLPRGDKVLPANEAEALLAGQVVVEEKIDGANLGLSTTAHGEIRVQNRGAYLCREGSHPQFRPLWSWLAMQDSALANALWPNLILFGEWCYAIHSVAYDRLPDWFLGFDVYDRSLGRFWDTERRDALLRGLNLHSVPRLAEGCFSTEQLRDLLLNPSRVGQGAVEGMVVRQESGGHTTLRAKIVDAAFTQAIDEHWSRGPLRRNMLARGTISWP